MALASDASSIVGIGTAIGAGNALDPRPPTNLFAHYAGNTVSWNVPHTQDPDLPEPSACNDAIALSDIQQGSRLSQWGGPETFESFTDVPNQIVERGCGTIVTVQDDGQAL